MLSASLTEIFTALVAIASISIPVQGRIQSPKATADESRADSIKAAYLASYREYFQYGCHGGQCADEIQPLSESNTSPLADWGASLVDALSTSYVMGLKDEFEEGIKLAENINFEHTSSFSVSLFETNIRFLGGLLSAYELDGKKNQKLVDQAKIVGDHLLQGWVGDNDLPFNTLLNWDNFGSPNVSTGAIIAETGTLVLEFYKLSKYTGNSTYADHADRSMKATANAKGPFPGLKGQGLEPMTNEPTDDYVSWGGGSDSYFEYLLKYGVMLGTTKTWIPQWISAVDSSIANLITTADQTDKNLTYLTDFSASRGGNVNRFSHLGCFVGASWIHGGKILKNDEYLDYGFKLTESCMNTYSSSVTGLGPEVWNFIGNKENKTLGARIDDKPFYKEHGFNYVVTTYVLRPEVLESVFYSYRVTGDKRYQDFAWAAFKSLLKYCKAEQGATNSFVAIPSVNDTNTDQFDNQQSFLYAETFKYLYLVFSDPSVISLDEYVFNTEAHPFEIEKPGVDLSSAQASNKKGSTKPTAVATQTNKKVDLPFFSNLPGANQEISASRTLEGILGGIGNVLDGVANVLDNLLKAKGPKGSKRDGDLVRRHRNGVKKRKFVDF